MAKFLALILLVVSCNAIVKDGLKLLQVIALSRHNIRAPLTEDSKMKGITSQKWPDWPTETAFLTAKGALLEGHMGEYFSAWLNKENLLSGCPEEGTVNIYANSKQRTIQSATAFTNAAFRTCNVTVNYKNITGIDPIFYAGIQNTTEAYKKTVLDEITSKLKNYDLKNEYMEIEEILDYKNSDECLNKHLCSLVNDENIIEYAVGKRPNIDGPLWIANIAVDSFLMSYYEGMPFEDIGWRKIHSLEQLAAIAKVISVSQDVKYGLCSTAKEFARPLLSYFGEILRGNETVFTLLMGHDSNINYVTKALGVKPFDLPGQIENYPIGGKLVFEKYVDRNNELYLKVEYIYLTCTDMREGVKVTLDNPPRRMTLELDRCYIDENGLCTWSTFIDILEDLL